MPSKKKSNLSQYTRDALRKKKYRAQLYEECFVGRFINDQKDNKSDISASEVMQIVSQVQQNDTSASRSKKRNNGRKLLTIKQERDEQCEQESSENHEPQLSMDGKHNFAKAIEGEDHKQFESIRQTSKHIAEPHIHADDEDKLLTVRYTRFGQPKQRDTGPLLYNF